MPTPSQFNYDHLVYALSYLRGAAHTDPRCGFLQDIVDDAREVCLIETTANVDDTLVLGLYEVHLPNGTNPSLPNVYVVRYVDPDYDETRAIATTHTFESALAAIADNERAEFNAAYSH